MYACANTPLYAQVEFTLGKNHELITSDEGQTETACKQLELETLGTISK